MRLPWPLVVLLSVSGCVHGTRPAARIVSVTGPMPAEATEAQIESSNGAVPKFKDYLQEVVDRVQTRWERILAASSTPPPSSAHVTITFRLDSQGQVSEIVKVAGDAGDFGTNAALQAISEPAPYRPWTKEMIAALGKDQVITFSFYYH